MLSYRAMSNPIEHQRCLEAVAEDSDREAFAQIFRHFAPRIKSYLLRGGANETEVDELVQEAMMRVWTRAKGFDPSRASASTWIFTIARNLRIDRIRKMKRVDVDPQDPALVLDEAPSPEQQTSARLRAQNVREALSNLPTEQATILSAMYFQGQSQSQIAETLELPLGTVKSRVRLAMKAVKTSLEPEEEVHP